MFKMKTTSKRAAGAAAAIILLAAFVAAATGAITGVNTITSESTINLVSGGGGDVTLNAVDDINMYGDDFFMRNDAGSTDIYLESGTIDGNVNMWFRPNQNSSDYVILSVRDIADGRQGMYFQANQDVDKQFIPYADSAYRLGTTSLRWSEIWADSINGADISFLNGVSMVECINKDGLLDICFVYGELTQDQIKTRSIAKHKTYVDYVISQDENGTNVMSENEFNLRKETITENGKLDLTFGRNIHMSMRDVKDSLNRLDEIEDSLCTQGLSKYC